MLLVLCNCSVDNVTWINPMEDVKNKFISELVLKPPELVASIWIIDRIPFLFDQDIEMYASWRCKLAKGLGVDPSSLVITGSCAFGVSLNPYKNVTTRPLIHQPKPFEWQSWD